jgi:hypothetical protein
MHATAQTVSEGRKKRVKRNWGISALLLAASKLIKIACRSPKLGMLAVTAVSATAGV